MRKLALTGVCVISCMVLLTKFTQAQTYYSQFTNPVLNADYSSDIIGVCLFCDIENPSRVADNDLNNYARMDIDIGVAVFGYIKTKLSGTASSGSAAGFVINNDGGLLDLAVLTGCCIKTYKQGVLQESVSGGSLAVLGIDGSTTKQSVHFTTSKDYDEIELRVGGLASVSYDFNVFYAYSALTPLPVELKGFYGLSSGNCNRLEWQTASEHNNSHFDVEKMYPEVGFMVLGSLKGAISSTKQKNYSFEDCAKQNKEVSYYRLKQVDLDGKYTYSDVIKVANDIKLKVYLSPQNNLYISDKSALNRVSIYNLSGQCVKQVDLNDDSHTDLNSLTKGIYVVSVEKLNGELTHQKVVIQ